MSESTTTANLSGQKRTLLSRNLIDTLSGSAGGVALVLVGHPFDTLKVRMQSDGGRFNGTLDCMKQTFAKEGLGGFYKGIGSPLVGVTAVNAICFASFGRGLQIYYSYINTESSEEEDKLRKDFVPTPYLFAGALTGVALSFVEGPVELIKAKLQVQYGDVKQYNGTVDCARKIIVQHGIRGIFQGYAATLARNVPANVAYFGSYEWMKKQLSQLSPNGQASPISIMAAGGLAGAMYWISTFPIDVIKSRMQVDASDPAKRQFRNMLHCAQVTYAQHGFKAFYWGFAPCLMRAFPANGACFFMYELTKKFLSEITVEDN